MPSRPIQCNARDVAPGDERGFTLVELAIVLVVVGLILGGVLKGREMIQSARDKALIGQVGETFAAWDLFVDRYRADPGDFPEANAILGAPLGVVWPRCDGSRRGWCNADGYVEWNERFLFWQHLGASNFLRAVEIDATPSKDEGTAYPTLLVGGYLSSWESGNPITVNLKDANRPGQWLEASLNGEGGGPGPLDAVRLRKLDLRWDDGNPGTGWVRALTNGCHSGNGGSADPNSTWDFDGEQCRIGFQRR